MDSLKNSKIANFSIIFKEIELYKKNNPVWKENMSLIEMQEDIAIREFGEICREINTSSHTSETFLTFS